MPGQTSAAIQSIPAFLVAAGATTNGSLSSIEHFGDPLTENAAFSSSAALRFAPASSCLLQEGSDALDLLHRLTTNDLEGLEVGGSRFTVLTSEKGRIIDVLNVARIAPDRLLLLSESPFPQAAVDWIEKFTIIEDSQVGNLSERVAVLTLFGPGSLNIAESAFKVSISAGSSAAIPGHGDLAALVASTWAGMHRVDVIVSVGELESAWTAMRAAGAVPVGDLAYETVRVRSGVPAVAGEISEDANPLEVQLEGLVSFTKGCYVGQEVVARLHAYDKVQRRLVRLVGDSPIAPGSELTCDGKRAGIVTSVAHIYTGDSHVALGFARRDYWSDGTVLESDGGPVTVQALGEEAPFV